MSFFISKGNADREPSRWPRHVTWSSAESRCMEAQFIYWSEEGKEEFKFKSKYSQNLCSCHHTTDGNSFWDFRSKIIRKKKRDSLIDLSKSLTALSEFTILITSGLTAKKVKKWQKGGKKFLFNFFITHPNTKQSTKIEFAKILFNCPGVWQGRMFHNL